MLLKDYDFQLIANSIRTLSLDAIQKANSGHPGMPLGCADLIAVLWSSFLIHNSADPKWINRDRFVLSAGHGSMLLYSILHLSGYQVSLSDLKNFRQLGSKTPGHPEFAATPGVENTSGPLGQGFANAVGMSVASQTLVKEFNSKIFNHYIYALVSDGDLMEGISSEAASLAGHLSLGNLIYFYDSNDISIEGDLDLTFSEKVDQKFKALNWQVQKINGHNYSQIYQAILKAQAEKKKPSLIIMKTKIAKGSATQEGQASSHGAPLGIEEIKASKIKMGFEADKDFQVPEKVYSLFKQRQRILQKKYTKWQQVFKKEKQGLLNRKWNLFFKEPNLKDLRKKLPAYGQQDKIATRSASGKVLEVLFKEIPSFLGGSADLGPSNKSFVKGFSETGLEKLGRNIHFGIREHAMGAIQNGIAYYGGFISFSATFFVFMDYMRPAIRLAALSKLPVVYVFTHDSFMVGEDGATHQPVEHLAAARALPNLNVVRPADAEETNEAWLLALQEKSRPTAIVLSRQNLPVIKKKKSQLANFKKGAYLLRSSDKKPKINILASGSEVSLALEVAEKLGQDKIEVQVASFPCWEVFDKQSKEYQKEILPPQVPVVVIEAGLKMGWEKYAGSKALYFTMEDFGLSGPASDLAQKFGFTVDNIVKEIKKTIKNK